MRDFIEFLEVIIEIGKFPVQDVLAGLKREAASVKDLLQRRRGGAKMLMLETACY